MDPEWIKVLVSSRSSLVTVPGVRLIKRQDHECTLIIDVPDLRQDWHRRTAFQRADCLHS